ncbi:Miro-related gtp-ase, partial [Thalictrum thalictroides]
GHNYSGKSNSGEKTDVRVVVAGDQGTGKTSLILAVQNEAFGKQVVPVLSITRLADNVYPDQVPVTIVDTSSK